MIDKINFRFLSNLSIIGNAGSGKSELGKELLIKLHDSLIVLNNMDLKQDIKELSGVKINNLFMKKIALELIKKPKYLILDDVLTFLNNEEKALIIKYAENNNIILINLTTNSEELLLFPYIIVINEHQVIMEGTKEAVMQKREIFNKLRINLPIVTTLSGELIDYQIIDQLYYDSDSLVGAIWK